MKLLESENKLLDERNFTDGKDYAVIIYNTQKFVSLIKAKLREMKIPFAFHSVEYVSRSKSHPTMGCFRKFDNYLYQNECRFVLKSPQNSLPVKINIGSLDGIATIPIDRETFLKQKWCKGLS